MSQAKVDKYKNEKANRKKTNAKMCIRDSIWTISRQKEAGLWLRQRAMRRTAGIIIKGA